MADASGIRAGRAYIELGAVDAGLRKALDMAAARLAAWGAAITAVGARLAALGGAAMAGLGAAVGQFSNVGAELQRMSERTGASVEALSALKLGAEQAGSDLATVEGAIKSIDRAFIDAANGADGAIDKLGSLGLTWRQLADLRPEQRLAIVAEQLSRIPNPAERAARSMEILGTTSLAPLLDRGIAGLRDLGEQAKALGVVMDAETAKGAAEFAAGMSGLRLSLQAVAVQIGAALAPALRGLMSAIGPVIKSTIDWVKENRGIVVAVAGGAAAVAGLGVGLVGLGVSMQAASVGLAGLSAGVGLLTAPLRLLASTASGAATKGFAALLAGGKMALGGLALLASPLALKLGLIAGAVGLAVAAARRLAGATGGRAPAPAAAGGAPPAAPREGGGAAPAPAAPRDGGGSGSPSRVQAAIAAVSASAGALWDTVAGGAGRAWGVVADTASSAWGSVRDTATTAWGGITAAIQSGDIGAAVKIATAAISLEWVKLTGFLEGQWLSFKGAFAEITYSLSDAAGSSWDAIQRAWVHTTSFLIGDTDSFAESARSTWQTLGEWMSSAWEGTVSGLSKAWDGFKSFFVGAVEQIKGVWESLSGVFARIAGPIEKALGPIRAFLNSKAGLAVLASTGIGAPIAAAAVAAKGAQNVAEGRGLLGGDPEEVARQKQERLDAIAAERQAKDAANQEARDAARAAREQERADLQARLAEAKKAAEDELKARVDAAKAAANQGKDGLAGKVKDAKAGLVTASQKVDVAGTFNARIAGQLGSRTVQDRIAAGVEKLVDHAKEQVEQLKKGVGGPAVAGG